VTSKDAVADTRQITADLERKLADSVAQQAATSEILRVISQSPTDVAPVFDAIVLAAARLFRCDLAFFLRCHGTTFSQAALVGPDGSPIPLDLTVLPIDPKINFPSRTFVSRQNLHLPDWSAIDLPEHERGIHETYGINSSLFLPLLLRAGECVGLLALASKQPRVFDEGEIALAESFRDQAVIAIENARLFNETKEALERQTATADILKVIARSPSDLQPVFHQILDSAKYLIGGYERVIILAGDDGKMRIGSAQSPREKELYDLFPLPLDGSITQLAIRERRLFAFSDVLSDPEVPPSIKTISARSGARSIMTAPLLLESHAIGAITITRATVDPFNEKERALLSTFADQAVIAIQNVKLFEEVQARTRDLQESLQQQSATAEVLKVISRSAFDLQTVLGTLTESAARLCEAERGMVYLRRSDQFHMTANFGFSAELERFARANPFSLDGSSTTARAAASGMPVQCVDLLADETQGELARRYRQLGGHRCNLGVPLRRDGQTIGVFTLTRQVARAFTDKQIELVQTFADQAVIAIENARLFNEVQERTEDLAESLQQQTATSDLLQVISRSAFDLQPIFDAIAERAVTLCGASRAFIYRFDGELLHMVASHNAPEDFKAWVTQHPIPPGRQSGSGRAVLERRTIHIHDVRADPEYTFGAKDAEAIRTILGVPIMKGDEMLGVMMIYHIEEVRPFTEKQIALVETFADQAAIAIENVRLFNEMQEALERQTATADILKVIASSPSDVQPVFQAIADRSNRLIDALSTTAFSLVDGILYLRAFTPTTQEADAKLQATFPAPLSAFSWGESIGKGEIYCVIDAEQEPEHLRKVARERGWRSALLVPLLRDGKPIGMIGPTRVEPGPFSDHHVQLMQTFADQAVIAISNVNLFEQVQQRTLELSRSLDDLRTAQDRLVQTEKLASLGQLTAGIAHEIKNPLNFVNNFSALSAELVDEMTEVFENPALDEANRRKELDEIRELLKSNLEKVVQHGRRADSIVKNMLLHSREGSGERRSADINRLVEESLNLAYHGARAEKPGFNITLKHDLDPNAGALDLYPQEMTRALLNLISNGFYAATRRKAENVDGAEPVLSAATRNLGETVEIRIRDNGTGISPDVREKMFNPFFTTKPTGEGTGLGLSMTHDIVVKQHGGRIDVETEPGAFTEFIITLPRDNGTVARSEPE
jgi:two-component system, NtrC family, sensor kinase